MAPSIVYKFSPIVNVFHSIANNVPLCVACPLSFMVNMGVAFVVQNYGSIDDLTYQVTKEALGLDVTRNHLQDPAGKEAPALQLIPYKTYQIVDHLHTQIGFLKAEQNGEGPLTDDTCYASHAHQYTGMAHSTLP